MKKFKKTSYLCLLLLVLFSCTNEATYDQNFSNENLKSNETNNVNRLMSRTALPRYSNDKLIVRFAPGVADSIKADLRDIHGVTNFKLCEHCSDDTIELWMFGNGINIEPKKSAIEQGSGGGVEAIVDVDYEFTFGIDLNNPDLGTANDYNYHSYIKSVNDGVTIAVLDTGIAPTIGGADNAVFTTPFLYNADGDGNPSILSGWDFVNHDHNTFDDNNGRHGTVVSSIITSILNESASAIPHQIMPLKVCDQYGKASYFDFLCATNFGLEHADILQMSLGWYDDGFGDFLNTIISSLINENPEVIIVTSAGNQQNNNDILPHYPSGYTHDNIIAVAAANKYANETIYFGTSNIANFSNYGLESVDVFSRGENIPFLGYGMSGTSFAAPFVTGVIARNKYEHPGLSTAELLFQVINSGIVCPTSFDTAKKVKFNKIILP
ncbi:MAG: hypothetical protein CMP76_12525 [Flavobacterium sp.]|uniref:S8 family serine peptidase n=1 Tax=unclassified Flavobacterium TaxID=196869 RepID=UPI000C3CA97F|nr:MULTISPECIES: S8 family serine peptidase [unclassified Flavobacterium]MBF04112.1 hypothetical protein [Flavobacterium sp.]MCO6163362.1 S8 family serine peptidase [Flavobacterium sp. NRK F7]